MSMADQESQDRKNAKTLNVILPDRVARCKPKTYTYVFVCGDRRVRWLCEEYGSCVEYCSWFCQSEIYPRELRCPCRRQDWKFEPISQVDYLFIEGMKRSLRRFSRNWKPGEWISSTNKCRFVSSNSKITANDKNSPAYVKALPVVGKKICAYVPVVMPTSLNCILVSSVLYALLLRVEYRLFLAYQHVFLIRMHTCMTKTWVQ